MRDGLLFALSIHHVLVVPYSINMLETINATQRRAILFTITLTTLAGYTAALTIPAPVSLLPIAYNLSGLTNTTLINSALSTDPPSGLVRTLSPHKLPKKSLINPPFPSHLAGLTRTPST